MHMAESPDERVIEDDIDRELFMARGISQQITPGFINDYCGLSSVRDFMLLPHDDRSGRYPSDASYAEGLPFAEQSGLLVTFSAIDPNTGFRSRYAYGLVGAQDTVTLQSRTPMEFSGDTRFIRALRDAQSDMAAAPPDWPPSVRGRLSVRAYPPEQHRFDNGAVVEFAQTRSLLPGFTHSGYAPDHVRVGFIRYCDGAGYSGFIDAEILGPDYEGQFFDRDGIRRYFGEVENGDITGDGTWYLNNGARCNGTFERGSISHGSYWPQDGATGREARWNRCSRTANGTVEVWRD